MNKGLISIIVPAYNAEKYIKKCLDSLVNQTYRNLQIIIIDDNSKDRTGEIIDTYAKEDSRIIVLHNKQNAGHSLVRNPGIELASGEYIGFVDSDDYVHEQMYEHLHYIMEAHNADIALCKEFAFSNNDEEPILKLDSDYKVTVEDHELYVQHFMDQFTGYIGWSCNKLFKAEIIKKYRYRDYFYEDIVFNAEVSRDINAAVWSDERLYAYRIYSESVTAAGEKNIAEDAAKSVLATAEYLSYNNKNFNDKYKIYILSKIANIYANCRTKHGIKASEATRQLFLNEFKKDELVVDNAQMKEKIKIHMAKSMPAVYCMFAKKN